MSYPYDPRVSYTGAQSISQGFAALAGGLQDFAQRQREAKQEADLLAAQNQKNDLIIGHLAGLKNPQGQPYVTPEQMAEYQGANAKKKKALAEGISANAAFDLFQAKQAQAQTYQSAQMQHLAAQTGLAGAQTNRLLNPPPPFTPTTGVASPPPGVNAPSQPYFQGSRNSATPITGANGEKLTLTKEELDAYKATGKVPLRISKGSFQAVNDPTLDSESVKAFDEHVGKTYGIKSADIFNLNLTEPNSIQYQDKDGKPLTTEQAAKAGYSATAVVPVAGEFGTKTKRIPLPEWNNIVNQWQQLPRAGVPGAGGVSVQGGNPSATHMLGPQDQAALDWALANPKDPRSAQIKQKLGIQ